MGELRRWRIWLAMERYAYFILLRPRVLSACWWLTFVGVGYWREIWTYGDLYRQSVWMVVVEVCGVSVEGETSGVGEVCGSVGGEAEF